MRFRKADEAESHSWQPTTVRALQTVVGSTKQGAALALTPFATFAAQAVEAEPSHLRDLLEIRPAGPELALRPDRPRRHHHAHLRCQRHVLRLAFA